MTTVSEVLNQLKQDGYTHDFNLADNCLVCHGNYLQVYPDEFVVDTVYRFEGESDPGDEAVIYAISSEKHNLKGTLVNGYGVYSDEVGEALVRTLQAKTAGAGQQEVVDRSNRATPQRPEGDRQLNAPLVEMDLNVYRQQLKQEQAWQTSDRNAITLFKSEGMRVVLVGLHNDAELKTHKAPGQISVQVLEGHIRFSTEEQEVELAAGQMLTLHAGISHRVLAREEAVFLLTVAVTPKQG